MISVNFLTTLQFAAGTLPTVLCGRSMSDRAACVHLEEVTSVRLLDTANCLPKLPTGTKRAL